MEKTAEAMITPIQSELSYAVEVFTGIRSTGNLTIGNYLGAVKPIIDLQRQGLRPLVFVADLHALTDREPRDAFKYRKELIGDYLALGLDEEKCDLFIQSDIADEVFHLMGLLSRHISVAELMRVPTLKDKLRDTEQPENANSLLALYPVMMAADILLQRPRFVPVGADQMAHMEVMRKLARRFNSQYGEVFPIPEPEQIEPLRLLGLKGSSKMSKTHPNEAIFLTDTSEEARKKIKTAQTAFAGEMPEVLTSHVKLAKGLASSTEDAALVDEIIKEHLAGKNVMGSFKQVLSRLVCSFLDSFQKKKREITADPQYVASVIESGVKIARKNAAETLAATVDAMARQQ